jgi:hypothetical protein
MTAILVPFRSSLTLVFDNSPNCWEMKVCNSLMPRECSALISSMSPEPSFKRSPFAFDLFLYQSYSRQQKISCSFFL